MIHAPPLLNALLNYKKGDSCILRNHKTIFCVAKKLLRNICLDFDPNVNVEIDLVVKWEPGMSKVSSKERVWLRPCFKVSVHTFNLKLSTLNSCKVV